MEVLQPQYHIVQRQRATQMPMESSGDIVLQINNDGIRILLTGGNDGRLLGLDEIRFTRSLNGAGKVEQFRHFVAGSLLAEARFPRVRIAVEPVSYSLVPRQLFSEEAAPLLLELAGNWRPQDGLFYENLHPEMVLVFSPGEQWLEYTGEIFDASEICWTSSFSGMLQFACGSGMEENALLACIGPETIHCFGKKDGSLRYFNRFCFRNEQDLLYYFLLGLEQSGLDPETAPVSLCGSIMSGSAGFEKISRYAGNIRFALPAEVPSDLPPASGIRHPQYFDLLSLLKSPAENP
jgi:hypothetical protein